MAWKIKCRCFVVDGARRPSPSCTLGAASLFCLQWRPKQGQMFPFPWWLTLITGERGRGWTSTASVVTSSIRPWLIQITIPVSPSEWTGVTISVQKKAVVGGGGVIFLGAENFRNDLHAFFYITVLNLILMVQVKGHQPYLQWKQLQPGVVISCRGVVAVIEGVE